MAKEPAALPLDDVIMSEADCALLLGLAPETLKAVRRRGEGPPFFQVTKGMVRYSKTSVLAWLQSRTVEGVTIKKVEESEL